MRMRGFEIAKGWENRGIQLPQRSTAQAAAYDIASAEDITVPVFRPGIGPTKVPTGLKAYCQPDECYFIFNRSSGAGKGLVLANGVGVIDADYYGNPQTDGHFSVVVFNVSDHDIRIKKGDRIAQAVFQKFLTVDDDHATGKRQGGFGSTDIASSDSSTGSTDCAELADNVPKPIRVIYDLDDVLWDFGRLALGRAGLGQKCQTDYRIHQDPAFTRAEADRAIAAFFDAQNYADCEFYPGAEDILDLVSPDVEVLISSNVYSLEVAAIKKQRLSKMYPDLPASCQLIQLVTPDTNRKQIGSDVLVFIDDSPYNIAGSEAKFNLMPRKTWNTTTRAQKLAIGSDKVYRQAWRRALPKLLASDQKYVIPVQDLQEVNEFVKIVINLKQEGAK